MTRVRLANLLPGKAAEPPKEPRGRPDGRADQKNSRAWMNVFSLESRTVSFWQKKWSGPRVGAQTPPSPAGEIPVPPRGTPPTKNPTIKGPERLVQGLFPSRFQTAFSMAAFTGWARSRRLLRARMSAIWPLTCSISSLKMRADRRRAPWPRMMSCSAASEVATRTRWRFPIS